MIESIEFENFKVLRDAKLLLSRCNILVGPNGSGKSTVLLGLEAMAGRVSVGFEDFLSVGIARNHPIRPTIRLNWAAAAEGLATVRTWNPGGSYSSHTDGDFINPEGLELIDKTLPAIRGAQRDSESVASGVQRRLI